MAADVGELSLGVLPEKILRFAYMIKESGERLSERPDLKKDLIRTIESGKVRVRFQGRASEAEKEFFRHFGGGEYRSPEAGLNACISLMLRTINDGTKDGKE